MSVFADSSALVKLYADETGAEEIRSLTVIAVSQLCRVEVPAALWRKQRLGELDSAAAQVLTAEFEADFYGSDNAPPRFSAVAASTEVCEDAARLCAVHGLRGYDAVQLASAVAVRSAGGGTETIAVFDRSLRQAAAAEGFALLPTELELR